MKTLAALLLLSLCGGWNVAATSLAKRATLEEEIVAAALGNVGPHKGPSAKEVADAILEKLGDVQGEAGCRDGTVEGRFPVSCNVQACAGEWTGHIADASDQICADGWHVCSPAENGGNARDAVLVGTIDFVDGKNVDGCYAYNANNDFGKCRHLNCDESNANDMGAVGKKCNLKSAQTSCLNTGRIDLKGRACGFFKKGETDGLLCCKDVVSSYSESGCKDASTEATFPSTDLVQGCAGKWIGAIDFAGLQLCAPGWDICSPVDVSFDAALLKKISFSEASQPSGCFPYKASNDFGQCRPLDCNEVHNNDLGAVGKSCNLKSGQKSCLASGRIDLKDRACSTFKSGVTTGVLCCKRA